MKYTVEHWILQRGTWASTIQRVAIDLGMTTGAVAMQIRSLVKRGLVVRLGTHRKDSYYVHRRVMDQANLEQGATDERP